ncbi:Hydroxysteroid dehydrogenase-like protein 2 [Cyphellophora attinorum]|uniref:Hydroxysteroid dehydrogenase-like protein 2 n=1 Tax=Cyphellophora attinorum TaxID=1664694 RepID=A0A0N1P3H5_9EURO|nr:Hydroxysteroid dehydrogenase-like protein 2 [Phialophora attinorum]KPI45207.1 Hydroxysteroid dehydrogenase-like protein 2 [Phialophora attinorum]
MSSIDAKLNPRSLPTALILGASRGIGRQLAISLATDPKTDTITTVAHEITLLGGHALALSCDVRDTAAVEALVHETVRRLGRLDVLIYNPGAIWWASVANTPPKRFNLMWEVNVRGCYAAVSAALPYLTANSIASNKKGEKGDGKGSGRIIIISPPIYSRFFRGKTAYAMTKVGMSVLVSGLAMDFDRLRNEAEPSTGHDLAVTALWPAASIESAATERAVNSDQDVRKDLRHPKIFGDAVLEILRAPVGTVNGKLLLDEDFLREECGYGDREIDEYAIVKGSKPRRIMPAKLPSLLVDEQADEGRRMDSSKLGKPAKL